MLKNVEMSDELVVAHEMKNLATEARTLFPEWRSIGVTFLDPVVKWRCRLLAPIQHGRLRTLSFRSTPQ